MILAPHLPASLKFLGSDFMTWGFYSHNIFVDFLAETGIIGFVLFVTLFIWIVKTLLKQCFIDEYYIFIMCIGLYGLVMVLFSGYWISMYQIWMLMGVAYGLRLWNKQRLDSFIEE